MSLLGRRWFGGRVGRLFSFDLGDGSRRRGGFLEVLQDSEVAEVHAVGAFDAALEAAEGFEGILIGVSERGIVLDGLVEVLGGAEIVVEAFDLVFPELGFDAAEAALGPFGGDEGIDQGALVGVGGPVVEQEFGRERLEFDGIFAADDVRPAWMPDLRAFREEAALPSGEVGPVDFWEFRRLASI